MKKLVLALVLFSTQVAAQETTVQDQLMTTYASINSNLAKQLDQAKAEISELKRKLAEATKEKKDAPPK